MGHILNEKQILESTENSYKNFTDYLTSNKKNIATLEFPNGSKIVFNRKENINLKGFNPDNFKIWK